MPSLQGGRGVAVMARFNGATTYTEGRKTAETSAGLIVAIADKESK